MRRSLRRLHVVFCWWCVCSFLLGLISRILFTSHSKNTNWQQFGYRGAFGNRLYFVYTPTRYKIGTTVPLVVMLHGCTQSAVDFASGTQMNLQAEQNNFIVVYPQQSNSTNKYHCWNWFDSANQYRGNGEPAIIAGIVLTMLKNTSQWNIDPNRIYVGGLSAGAAMAVILGATYPDIFAAIAIHSGFEYQATTTQRNVLRVSRWGGPDPLQQGLVAFNMMGAFAHITPTIVLHGTNDYIIDCINGDQVVQQWMQTNLLASKGQYNANFKNPSTVITEQTQGGRSYTISRWKDGSGTIIQEYWKINGMGHAWSGGSFNGAYTDPQGPNASRAIYQFLIQHAKKHPPTSR